MTTQTPFQLIAAPFTPMKPGGAIDLNRVKPYYEFLRERGVDGAFVCGTTGEGALMTAEERKQVVAAWTAARGSDRSFRIFAHAGRYWRMWKGSKLSLRVARWPGAHIGQPCALLIFWQHVWRELG
jgi:hypothetical protein